MIAFMRLLVAMLASLCAQVAPAVRGAATPPTAKHLVLLVVDDLGYGDLGYTGSAVKTPVLDELATTGVILSNYYVMRACSPTRASLATGRFVIRYGMNSGVIETGQAFGLNLGETILPQALRKASTLLDSELRSAGTGLSCASGSFHEGWNCDGGGLGKGLSPVTGPDATSDPTVCCSLCSAHSGCAVWTVYHGKCYLKSAACKPEKAVSVSGGNMTVPPPPSAPTRPCSTREPSAKPVPGSWAAHAVGKVRHCNHSASWCAIDYVYTQLFKLDCTDLIQIALCSGTWGFGSGHQRRHFEDMTRTDSNPRMLSGLCPLFCLH